MYDFPKNLTFHFGKYVNDAVIWCQDHLQWLFNAINSVLLWILLNIKDFLLWMPWWAFIIVIFLLATFFKDYKTGILFSIFLFIIGLFGYWDLMMMTLSIVVSSVIVSILLGIPIGILMSYSNRFESIITPILDGMQTMPSFVYLIPVFFFFDLGMVPGVFATVIYSLPPVIRLTNIGIRGVAKEVVEAGQSFGASRSQLLMKVQIPQALPTIMAGINQTTMMALAMVVVASMVGAKGLGQEVLISINQLDISRGFEAGISIVFIAIIIDRITLGISDWVQKR